jgi:hypothetical protein
MTAYPSQTQTTLFSSFVFASFTFGFVHQFQTAENTILLVIENIFLSGVQLWF